MTKYESFSLVYGQSTITLLNLLLKQSEIPTDEDIENDILNQICQVVNTLEPTLKLAK
jgi:hypothetical protein